MIKLRQIFHAYDKLTHFSQKGKHDMDTNKKKLPGVFTAKKKDNSIYYRSSITFNNKHISLGSYSDLISANQAYKGAEAILFSRYILLSHYTNTSLLPFNKWVCLINFRDNGIYFPTPIYLKNKFFLYYLEPFYALKFDIDDLFYYSAKKIMRRGGHLFVNDYGMQFNIMNRYGIKNYAVEGKDYRFINGDPSDFRYENIEILNRFHGITRKIQADGGNIIYKVHIHIKSSYVVGSYSTEAEAAIAYNKAVDILKKNGINRNYSLNYIEDLSPAAYAEIYMKLKISPKISELKP